MELLEEVSSKRSKPDDYFELHVLEPVFVNGQIVIPAKARAVGQVIDSQKSGIFGTPAKLLIAIRYADVGGKRIPMRFYEPRFGTDRTNVGIGIGVVPLVGIFAAFLHGGQIILPIGTVLVAKVAKDIPVSPILPTQPATEVVGQPKVQSHDEVTHPSPQPAADHLPDEPRDRPNP
jgi:hypothetical protein